MYLHHYAPRLLLLRLLRVCAVFSIYLKETWVLCFMMNLIGLLVAVAVMRGALEQKCDKWSFGSLPNPKPSSNFSTVKSQVPVNTGNI